MNFPEKCPYCGKDFARAECVEHDQKIKSKVNGDIYYSCEIHYCVHCKKPVFVTYLNISIVNAVPQQKVVQVYPTNRHIEYPETVKDLSPNSYKAFSQACQAREMGQDMLVGAGLRIALEWLVWDYLITVKEFKKEEIEHLKLAKRVEKMDASFYTKICSDVVRHFGNDEVHVVKLFDFSIDEGFEIYTILCGLIDGELKIINANKRLSQRHS